MTIKILNSLQVFLIVVFLIVFASHSAKSQAINFDVPGGAGGVNYSGQGAYSDSGNNFWNAIAGGSTTLATNRLSDGITHSPITLTSNFGGTYGTQGTQGTASGLQQPYEYNNGMLQTDTLNNVPAGTYNLYLYGINNSGTRGTTYTVSTPIMAPVSLSTSNTPGSLTRFTQGADYVIFSNVVVGSVGTITFSWIGNPNVSLAGNNEGDFNAAQLVHVSTNTAITNSAPNFGPNVLVFDPSTTMGLIQNDSDGLFAIQQNNQFGTQRYACLFKPGQYSNLVVNVGYYTQIIGVGQTPDDVVINGDVRSDGVLPNQNATVNFWRSCDNLAIVPSNNGTMTWAVSQGTWLRRMHIEGSLNLSDTQNGAYSSGGFLADSAIDSTVSSITQQQWLSRNDIWGNWSGGVWNMVFVGVSNPPTGYWPNPPITVITNTPLVREKPFLTLNAHGNFQMVLPSLRTNSLGTTWSAGPTPGTSIPISRFYLAQPEIDNAGSINAALNAGQHLILTPGVYNLTNSIVVTNPDTIVFGLGYPTLVPTNGNPAMVIDDVNGVNISGIIFDAGTTSSPYLLEVGTVRGGENHSADPICLHDICSRVGGATVGTTATCVTINANDVIGDNLWLWRADHGAGASWYQNASNDGLVVNGDRVTIYGLFVEHHEMYQTLWKGNWGRVYFYQSELPYDAPSQSVWTESPGVNGYASYKVDNAVTSHQAYGLGIYGVFSSTTTSCFNAIEIPSKAPQVDIHNMINVCITAESGSNSQITHIINGNGSSVGPAFGTTTADSYWINPAFNIVAGTDSTGTNLNFTLPTESCRAYQLQYKSLLNTGSWLNLGAQFGGNDAQETIMHSDSGAAGFFRVIAQ